MKLHCMKCKQFVLILGFQSLLKSGKILMYNKIKEYSKICTHDNFVKMVHVHTNLGENCKKGLMLDCYHCLT